MSKRNEIIQQTKIAFEFIQKLYFEVSYLIKEVEGSLGQEAEEFVICKPSGYGINTRSSTGLEPNNVYFWPIRKLGVSFVPKDMTETVGGITHTKFSEDLKVIYLRVVMDSKDLYEPMIYAAVFYKFEKKDDKGKMQKFENAIGHLEYNDEKLFNNLPNGEYNHKYLGFNWNAFELKLFDLNSADEVAKKLVDPLVKLYRGI